MCLFITRVVVVDNAFDLISDNDTRMNSPKSSGRLINWFCWQTHQTQLIYIAYNSYFIVSHCWFYNQYKYRIRFKYLNLMMIHRCNSDANLTFIWTLRQLFVSFASIFSHTKTICREFISIVLCSRVVDSAHTFYKEF